MKLVKIEKIVNDREMECWVNPEKIVYINSVQVKNGRDIYYLHLEDDVLLRIPEHTFNLLVNNLIEGMQ